jgi:predicted PurR-regulated permease PerM
MADPENRQEPESQAPPQGAKPAEAPRASPPVEEWSAFPTQFARLFFAAITLLVLYYTYAIIKPYLIDIFLAFVLFIIAKPLFNGLNRIFFGRKALASAATCLLLTLIILIPLIAMVSLIATQALELSTVILEELQDDHFGQWIDAQTALIQDYLMRFNLPMPRERLRLESIVRTVLARSGEFIHDNAGEILKGFISFPLHLALVVLVAFFMFLRGDEFVGELKKLSPLDMEHNDAILGEMEATIKATMLSIVAVAMVEGVMGGLAFWVAGLPYAAFWGAVMILASVLPVVGISLIWVPGVIYLFLQGHVASAMGLTIFFLLLAGVVESVLRPFLSKGTRHIPIIFVLFAILGGLSYFGMVGFILGPLILSFLLSLLQIYRKTVLTPALAIDAAPPEKKGPSAPSGDGS